MHWVPARNQNLCHQRQVWVKLQLALHLLLLMILHLYHLPPSFPPAVNNSSCLFTWCQPLYATCCTILLYFSRCCTVRLKMFYYLCLVFIPCLCGKNYKPIAVQYYIADCVSGVPRLTLLDLWTNWTYEHALGMKLIHMQGIYWIQDEPGASCRDGKWGSIQKVHNDCAMSKKQRSTRRTPKGQTGNNLNNKIY